ncbi:uncharacterized protein LOC116850561 [Odontomachus brunneus]|uniref:uncharacterized protein LOC116850561 n=1 Tax=Odontomachus brunneus TaxID=486640 RepID=UPI0013F2B032|nr:uncharacterized protein LOC116850561 [Odontomachus brunneus]
MDIKKSAESTKETCSLPNKPLECIRKFPLIQQFPSTIKEFNSEPWSKLNIKYLSTIATGGVKDGKNKSNLSYSNIPCKKLRIVSPNGKDLGEFNVEMRGETSSKGQIYTITKSNMLKSDLKPVILTLNPLAKKTVPRILRQPPMNLIKNKIAKIMSADKSYFIKNDKLNVSPMEHITLNGNSQTMNISEEIQSCDEMKDSGNNILIPGNETDQKSSLDCTADDNSQKHSEINHTLAMLAKSFEDTTNNINTLLKADKIRTSTTLLKNNEVSSTKKDIIYKEIAESPFPKVTCERIVVLNDNIPTNSEVPKRKNVSTTKITKKKTGRSPSKVLNSIGTYKQKVIYPNKKGNTKTNSKNNSKNHKKQIVSLRKRNNMPQNNSKVIHKTKKIHKTRTQKMTIDTRTQKKNIMTIVPSHNNFSLNKNAVSTLEHSKYHTTLKKVLDHKNSLLGNDVQFENSESRDIIDMFGVDIQSNKRNKDCSKDNSSQKDISEQWDVIKKAVNSVKDEELRAQALKALADCGIGVERLVPKRPPENLKAVHDTQVQTTVFGLLDPKFFLLMNKDVESIQKIQQITLHDSLHTQDLSSQNNLISDIIQQPAMSKNCDVIEKESDFDIDSFINQICDENLGALQVKETLSMTNTKYQKIIDQLQKDFELIKKYDENGMLSIHNAIVKNNIFDVQRYLMVLKQSKESVDIMTMDGTTSLELAIKYDVRGDIVKLLLQSGAQPVRMQPLHESALIIAAKQSSTLLPMLVNYVSDPKLLDQVDSEGFTPLHYCCKHGNVEGVNALLSAGVNVNLKDMKSGRTSLFHALESDNIDNRTKVVQRLLQAEATTSIMNFAGQPPLPLPSDEKRSTFMMSLRKSTKMSLPSRYLL